MKWKLGCLLQIADGKTYDKSSLIFPWYHVVPFDHPWLLAGSRSFTRKTQSFELFPWEESLSAATRGCTILLTMADRRQRMGFCQRR